MVEKMEPPKLCLWKECSPALAEWRQSKKNVRASGEGRCAGFLQVIDKPSGFLCRNKARPVSPEVSLVWLGWKGIFAFSQASLENR